MYIDPGVGSIMIQAIVGFVLAVPVFIGLYWRKVKSWLSRKKVASETKQPEL